VGLSARLASIAALRLPEAARRILSTILEAYYAWSLHVLSSLGDWRRSSAASRAAYLSANGGLTPRQVHMRDGAEWRQFFDEIQSAWMLVAFRLLWQVLCATPFS
jgi:hypothetical protein